MWLRQGVGGPQTFTVWGFGSRVQQVSSFTASEGRAVHPSSRSLPGASRRRVIAQPIRSGASCGLEAIRVFPGERMNHPMVMYWDEYCSATDLQALWSQPSVRAEWILAGHEPGRKVRVSRNAAGQYYVTEAEMRALAEITIGRHFIGLDPVVICAIADVESDRLALAYRFEPSVKEASTGLMQTLQSTAEWLANEMGYRAYGAHQSLESLYRPFVSVYFGAAYVKWLSTYEGKKRTEEFVVRGYNGGPKGATSHYTLAYWNKYLLAKQRWTCGTPSAVVRTSACAVPKPVVADSHRDNPTGYSRTVPAPGPAWTYWDEKACAEDMEEMWRDPEVRIEWEKAGERRGKVRFSRNSQMQPYLTQTELKAVASIIVRKHFQHKGVKQDMLIMLAEVSSKRLLHGWGPGGGIMQITPSTAQWLYRDMGYRLYSVGCGEDLRQPFVSMYFGAAYVSWLSGYKGRHQLDEFIVRAYHGGPGAADKSETLGFWIKFLEAKASLPKY